MYATPRLAYLPTILRLDKCVVWSDSIAACLKFAQACCNSVRPQDAFAEMKYQVCRIQVWGTASVAEKARLLLQMLSRKRLLLHLRCLSSDCLLASPSRTNTNQYRIQTSPFRRFHSHKGDRCTSSSPTHYLRPLLICMSKQSPGRCSQLESAVPSQEIGLRPILEHSIL